jgi:hypothetical protein
MLTWSRCQSPTYIGYNSTQLFDTVPVQKRKKKRADAAERRLIRNECVVVAGLARRWKQMDVLDFAHTQVKESNYNRVSNKLQGMIDAFFLF